MNSYYIIRLYLILFSYWSLRKKSLELDSLDSVKRNFSKIRFDETFYHKLWLISRRVINTYSRWKIWRWPKKNDMDFKSIDKKNHVSYSLSGQDLFVIYCIDSSNKPNSYLIYS